MFNFLKGNTVLIFYKFTFLQDDTQYNLVFTKVKIIENFIFQNYHRLLIYFTKIFVRVALFSPLGKIITNELYELPK